MTDADGVEVGTASLADYTGAIRQASAAMEEALRQAAGARLDPMALGERARLMTTEMAPASDEGVDAFRVAAAVLEDAAANMRMTAGLYATTEDVNRASVTS